jgi:hypothetical protein
MLMLMLLLLLLLMMMMIMMMMTTSLESMPCVREGSSYHLVDHPLKALVRIPSCADARTVAVGEVGDKQRFWASPSQLNIFSAAPLVLLSTTPLAAILKTPSIQQVQAAESPCCR